jgi:hypothetical protein
MCRKKCRDDGGVPFVPAFLFAVGFCRWYNGHGSRLEAYFNHTSVLTAMAAA